MYLHYVFPLMVVMLFAIAGAVDLLDRRYNDAVYSFAAALLNFAVYFKPFH